MSIALSQRYFLPLHRQPVIERYGGGQFFASSGPSGLVHTEAVADRVIALPFFNQLTEREIQEVCGALDESLREVGRKM